MNSIENDDWTEPEEDEERVPSSSQHRSASAETQRGSKKKKHGGHYGAAVEGFDRTRRYVKRLVFG